MLRWLVLLATHTGMLGIGFALGIYFLPILTAPKSPDATELRAAAQATQYKASFRRDLKGSDLLHWGEGEVHVGKKQVVHMGRLAPGPDYKLYLARNFVDTKEGFLRIKAQSRRIADIETFNGFIAQVPEGTNVDDFTSVVVWCEAFSQFISAAKYR